MARQPTRVSLEPAHAQGRLAVGRHVEVKRALGHALHWPELTAL